MCELLASTGLLGNPVEYFHEANLQKSGLSPKNPADLRERFDWMMQNTATDNGVVGAKLFIFDLQHLASAGMLEKFANFKFLYLQRRDKLSQAISIRKALITGRLTSAQPTSSALVNYDYHDIRLRIIRTVQAERGWEAFFRSNGITPVRCVYEGLAAAPQVVVDRIAAAIGLPSGPPINSARLQLKVQRDATNRAWQDRFLTECAEREPDLHTFCTARLATGA